MATIKERIFEAIRGHGLSEDADYFNLRGSVYIEIGDAEVIVDSRSLGEDDYEVKINWSALGSRPVAEAETMRSNLQIAIDVARSVEAAIEEA